MDRVDIAIIGGSGLEKLFEGSKQLLMKTPYGTAPPISVGDLAGKQVLFLPRHGPDHAVPPHRVNYRANIYALHKCRITRLLATNAVGAINPDFKRGDLVAPHDFIDFTKNRRATYFEKAPVTHVDFSRPYCPEIRRCLSEAAGKLRLRLWNKAVMVCTEGPRLETPAEIEMFRRLGCDVVGMTGFPEVALARELEMCYASVCYVSNMAAGMRERLSARELSVISRQTVPKLQKLLTETIRGLRIVRKGNCRCASALVDARFK